MIEDDTVVPKTSGKTRNKKVEKPVQETKKKKENKTIEMFSDSDESGDSNGKGNVEFMTDEDSDFE